MAEQLEVYDLKGKFLGVKERNKFYNQIKKEFNKKGKITRQVKRIILLLMNSKGRIYLQKRSKLKNENPSKFTEDIKFMIKKYEKFLKPIK